MQPSEIKSRFKSVQPRHEDTYIIDTYTGEVVGVKENKRKPKFKGIEKEVGVDVKYPSECRTPDQLLETLSVLDSYIDNPLQINDTFLIDNAIAGNITISQQAFLRQLATKVCGWNYYIGDIQELCSLGVDRKSLSRMLKSLTPMFIKTVRTNDPYKDCITLKLNPLMVWKGDNYRRSASKCDWYGIRMS